METVDRENFSPRNAFDEAENVQEWDETEDCKLQKPLPEQPEETISLSPKVNPVTQCLEDEEEEPPLNTELQHGYRILSGLMVDSNKSANWPFMDPVDASAPGLEDYYDKISSPMWLKKMKQKFDERVYESITEFVADFRLMLENCYRYNGPDHYVSKRGQRLETMLEQKLALLPRELRFKTSIEATTKDHTLGDMGPGSLRRRHKHLVPHDSSLLLNQLREAEVQREKDLRKQMIADKKAAQEAYINELIDWENELLGESFRNHFKAMWELPQIGHFLYLCQEPLNIGEVSQHELERSFCMPRESSTLQRVMTALLSTPHQRTKFDKKKMMSYNTWEGKLRIRLRQWYKVFDDQHSDIDKAAEKLGLDPYFFDVVGKRNPLEKKRFHQLSHYRQVWIVKSLCDNCLENQESLRDAIEFQPFEDQRDYLLGVDDKGNRYIHFPQFCGADLRIYRQSKFKEPTFSASEPEDNADGKKSEHIDDNEIKTPKKKRKKKRSQRRKKKTGTVKVEQDSKPVQEDALLCSDASGDEGAISDTSMCSSLTSFNVNNSCSSTRESSPSVFVDRTSSDSSALKSRMKMRNGVVRDLEKGFTGLSPRKKRNTGKIHNFDELEQFSDDSQFKSFGSSLSGSMNNGAANKSANSCKNETIEKSELDQKDISDTSRLGVSSLWCYDDNSTCDSTCSDSLPGSSTTILSRVTNSNCDKYCKVEESSEECLDTSNSKKNIADSEPVSVIPFSKINFDKESVKNIKVEPPDENNEELKEHSSGAIELTDINTRDDNKSKKPDEVNSNIEHCITNKNSAIKPELLSNSPETVEFIFSSTVKQEDTLESEESSNAGNLNFPGKDQLLSTEKNKNEKLLDDVKQFENIKSEKNCTNDNCMPEENSGISEYRPDHTYSNFTPSVSLKQDDEEEEEEEELLPQLGDFELVGQTVEDLRNLVTKFSEPEPIIVRKGKKKKIVKPPTRKNCIIDLHAQLEFLLHELEPWEGKLLQATKKARLRMRKEKEEYMEEKEEIWESASEETASSTDSDDESDVDSESDKPDLLIIKEKTNKNMRKKVSVQDSDSSSMDISLETDISSRGRIRKRRIIPNNTEDQGIKKKKSETASSENVITSHVPNILQKQSKTQLTSTSCVVNPTTTVNKVSLQTASDYVKFHSSQNPGQIILQPGLKQGGSQQKIVYGLSPQTLMNLRLITSKTRPQEISKLTSGTNSSSQPSQPFIKIEPRMALKQGTLLHTTKTELASKLGQGVNNKIQSHPVMQQLLAKQPLQAQNFAPTHSSVRKTKVDSGTTKSQNVSNDSQPRYLSIPPGYRLIGPSDITNSSSLASKNSQLERVTDFCNVGSIVANQTQVILSGQAATIVGYDDKGNKIQYVTNVNSLPGSVLTQIIRGNSLKIQATHSVTSQDSNEESPCETSSATLHTGTCVSPSHILSQSKQGQKYAGNMTVKALLAAQSPTICISPSKTPDTKSEEEKLSTSVTPQMLQNRNDLSPTAMKILSASIMNTNIENTISSKEKRPISSATTSIGQQLNVTHSQQVYSGSFPITNTPTCTVQKSSVTSEKIVAAVPQVSGNQLVLSLQVPTTAVNQLNTIKLPSKAVLDSAVKAVVTSVVTSLPTVHMKVPSPSTLPTIQPRKNVTKTIQSMKSPITVTPKLESKVRSATNISASVCKQTDVKRVPSTGNILTSTAVSGMGAIVTQAHSGNKLATLIQQQSSDIRNVVKITPQTFLTSQGYLQGFVSPQGIIIPQQNIKTPSTTASANSITPIVTTQSVPSNKTKPEVIACSQPIMFPSAAKLETRQLSASVVNPSPIVNPQIVRQNLLKPASSVNAAFVSQINGQVPINSIHSNASHTLANKKDLLSPSKGQAGLAATEIQFSPGGQFVSAVPPQGYVELVLPKCTISSNLPAHVTPSSNQQQRSASEIVRHLAAKQMMNVTSLGNKSSVSAQKNSVGNSCVNNTEVTTQISLPSDICVVTSVLSSKSNPSQTLSSVTSCKRLKTTNPLLSTGITNIHQNINVDTLQEKLHCVGTAGTTNKMDVKLISPKDIIHRNLPSTSSSTITGERFLPVQMSVQEKNPHHSGIMSPGSNAFLSHSLQSSDNQFLSSGTTSIVNVKPESLNQISNLNVSGYIPGGQNPQVSPNKLLLYNLGGQLVTPHGVPVTVEKGFLKVLPMASVKVGMETVTFRAPDNVVNYKQGKNVANSPKSPLSPVLNPQGVQGQLTEIANTSKSCRPTPDLKTQVSDGVLNLSVSQSATDNRQMYENTSQKVKGDSYVLVRNVPSTDQNPPNKHSTSPIISCNTISPPVFTSSHSRQCDMLSVPIDCSLQARSISQTQDKTNFSSHLNNSTSFKQTDQQKQIHLQNFLQQNTTSSAVKRLAFPSESPSQPVPNPHGTHQAASVQCFADSALRFSSNNGNISSIALDSSQVRSKPATDFLPDKFVYPNYISSGNGSSKEHQVLMLASDRAENQTALTQHLKRTEIPGSVDRLMSNTVQLPTPNHIVSMCELLKLQQVTESMNSEVGVGNRVDNNQERAPYTDSNKPGDTDKEAALNLLSLFNQNVH